MDSLCVPPQGGITLHSGHNHTAIWGALEHQASVKTTSSVQGYDHLQEKTADLSSHLRALQP